MIYQFEHDEIKRCRECPMHISHESFNCAEECALQDCQIAYDSSPQENDCPLVAISKTETTSCEWCEKIGKYAGFAYATFFEQTAPDEQYEVSVECNYCPACGRKLN